jgi:pimeloyl-[acyl-carrier protein] methyl ester esterase
VVKQPPHLVLLPGLDGTGELFRNFLHELPSGYGRTVVSYPTTLSSYADLDPIVRRAIPEHAAYVLLAESFSSPLAIQIASTNPGYLCGLILCGGFGSSPIRGLLHAAAKFAAPWLFRRDPHEMMLRRFLIGADASDVLIGQVRKAIHQVPARVLADRLREVLRCDVLRDIRNIWVPILCLRGSADRLVGETCAKEILSKAQREESRSGTLEGPHLLLQARAAACVDEIADFLHHSC